MREEGDEERDEESGANLSAKHPCAHLLCPIPTQSQHPSRTLSTHCSSQPSPSLQRLFLPTAPTGSVDFALLRDGFALLRVHAEPLLLGQ